MKRRLSALDEIEIQLSLADKISRVHINTSSPEEVARHTVAELLGSVPIDFAGLALLDGPSQKVRLVRLVGDGDAGQEEVFPVDGTPFGWVAENKRALLETEPGQAGQTPSSFFGNGLKAAVHMPLMYQGEVFGVLSTGSRLADAYGKSQLRLLRHTAAQLAVALKSALLLEKNLKVEASLADLGDLLGVFTSSPELSEVFPAFAQRLKAVVPFDRLSLAHVEGNALRMLAVFGEQASHPTVDEVCLLSDSAIPWMQQHEEINVAEDFTQERRFPVDEMHLREGFRGEIRVPLFSHGRLFASLHLVSKEPYQPGEELDFLRQLAGYLATPVESYVLYRHERQRLDWLAALSHHLGTPLTPIVSSSELLAEDLQKKRGRKVHAQLAQNILSSAQSMKRNLKLFRDLTQAETPGLSMHLETVDPKPILSQAVEEAQARAGAGRESVVLGLPDSLPQVSADASKLKQVLDVLLENSIGASQEGSTVEVRARAEGRHLVVEVIDAGRCFSEEEKEGLLQPYRLSEADRRSLPELTLALATCRRLVELHGGKLWLEGNGDEASVFAFSLPTAEA